MARWILLLCALFLFVPPAWGAASWWWSSTTVAAAVAADPPQTRASCNAAAAWARVLLANATAQRGPLVAERRRAWARWSLLRREDRLWRFFLTNGTAGCGCETETAATEYRARVGRIALCQAALRARAHDIDAALARLPAAALGNGDDTVAAALAAWEEQVRCHETERWMAAQGFSGGVPRGLARGAGQWCTEAFAEGVARAWAPRVRRVQQLAAVAAAARAAAEAIGCDALVAAASTLRQ